MAARNQSSTNGTAELRILRRKKVETKTGISRSTIYNGIKKGTFPKQIQLGQQSVGWLESEIDAWLRDRIAASRSGSAI